MRKSAVAAALVMALVAGACSPLTLARWWTGDFDGDLVADLVWFDEATGGFRHDDQPTAFFTPTGAGPFENVAGSWDPVKGWDPAAFAIADAGTWQTGGTAGNLDAAIPGPLAGLIPVPGDYDNDGLTEPAWFRTADATWFVEGQAPLQHGVGWSTVGGYAAHWPVPADYDGDGDIDPATYDPVTATWHVAGQAPIVFGEPGALPAPADYDGGLPAELAAYGTATDTWHIQGRTPVAPGRGADHLPVPADYDGDQKAEAAFFDPATGDWTVEGAGTVATGNAGERPAVLPAWRQAMAASMRHVNACWAAFAAGTGTGCGIFSSPTTPGDIDGDGDADYVYFTPQTTSPWADQWWLVGGATPLLTIGDGPMPFSGDLDGQPGWEFGGVAPGWWWRTTNPAVDAQWAPPMWDSGGTAIPVPGDYDGDGTTERAYFLTASATWLIEGMDPIQFGAPSGPGTWCPTTYFSIPVPADYDGDGTTDLAVYDPCLPQWHIRGQAPFSFGTPGAMPAPADYLPGRPGVELGAVTNWKSAPVWLVGDPLDGSLLTSRAGPVGIGTDLPAPADYDGDGDADPSWVDSNTRTWRTMDLATGVVSVVVTLPAEAMPALTPTATIMQIVRLRYIETCHQDPGSCS